MGKSFCIIPNLSKGEVHDGFTCRLLVVVFHEWSTKENVGENRTVITLHKKQLSHCKM